MDESLAPLGRLRRELVARQGGDEVGRELDGIHELALRRPGMLAAALDRHLQLARRERLDLELADARAVERVGGLGPERLDVEVVGAAPDLLVDRERDPHRGPRLVRAAEVRDGGHDLGDAGLVVGAEQRRAVARDDVVADARRERRLLGRIEHLARVARAARSARRRSPRGRSASPRRRATRGVVSTWAIRPITGAPGVPGNGREHVAVLVQLDVGEPDLPQLRRRGGARGRAAWRCSDRSSLPRPPGCRCGRSGGTARARPSASSAASGESMRDASQGRRGDGRGPRPSRSRAAGTRPGCARSASGCSTR